MSYYANGPVLFQGISFVTATPAHYRPGDRVHFAGEEYVYVYNDANSDFAPTYLLQAQSGATGYSLTITNATNTGLPLALVKHATLPTANYGWGLVKGFGTIEMTANSGTVAVNGLLTPGVDGTCAPGLVQTQTTSTDGATIRMMQPVGQALAEIVTGASGAAYVSLY